MSVDVLIHSPYPRQRSQGNAVSVRRMAAMLASGGLAVAVHERGDAPVRAKCLIALNARKSAAEIFDFHRRQPECPVVALLTGTDVNHPDMLDAGSATRGALGLCDAIVSLHDGFSHRIPESLLEKTTVIHPSVVLPPGACHRPEEPWSVVVAGNFRAEKNPALMLEAVRRMSDTGVHFHAFGLGGDYQAELEQTAAAYPRFHFHGVREHGEVLEKMQTSRVLLNTSTEEGGANAICEAIAIGLPVIATRIAGNTGMLGSGYEGLFPSENAGALVEILRRAEADPHCYRTLKSQVAARSPLFNHEREADQWLDLIRRLGH